MSDIVTTLKNELGRLTAEIEVLQDRRAALDRALAAVGGGEPVRPTRRPPRTRRPGRRRTRGSNQQRVLRALSVQPRRLSAIAGKTRLSMSNAGAVLRALINRGLAKKGETRGTYLLKQKRGAANASS